jgi:hypothetical protein
MSPQIKLPFQIYLQVHPTSNKTPQLLRNSTMNCNPIKEIILRIKGIRREAKKLVRLGESSH